jgi:hypothetical protein
MSALLALVGILAYACYAAVSMQKGRTRFGGRIYYRNKEPAMFFLSLFVYLAVAAVLWCYVVKILR